MEQDCRFQIADLGLDDSECQPSDTPRPDVAMRHDIPIDSGI